MPFTEYEPLEINKQYEIWKAEPKCIHPEHEPPGHIVLKPGVHTYECPKCGQQRRIVVNIPIFKAINTEV
jgi:hypothetical protein